MTSYVQGLAVCTDKIRTLLASFPGEPGNEATCIQIMEELEGMAIKICRYGMYGYQRFLPHDKF